MASNRLKLVQGASAAFAIDLTDADGEALDYDRLVDAVVTFGMRVTADGSDIVRFTSPDATHLTLSAKDSALTVEFTSGDTAAITTGAYLYEIRLTFADGDVEIPIEWAPIDVGLGGSADPTPPTFDNTVKLDHDYGLTDDLRYMTPGGSPIENAQVRVYLKSDYDAGNLASPVGITTTNAYGRWTSSILVTPGYTFVVQFYKPNEYGPDAKEIVAL